MHKLLLLAAVIVLITVLMYAPGKQSGHEQVASPGSFMEDVRVVNMKDGVHRWSLSTDRTVLSEDGSLARMMRVTLKLPSEEMTVRADSGLYDTDSNDLSLSGNISAETNNYTIRTESVLLRSKNEEISSDDDVVIEGDGFRIEGKGLSAANKTVRLLRDVKAVFF
jgi:LPS export ABC transporter protein LptC